MATSKTTIVFILISLFFNLMTGIMVFGDATETVNKYRIFNNVRDTLDYAEGFDLVDLVFVPFLFIDSLIVITMILLAGILHVPFWIQIFFLTPVSIMVTVDYIIPTIRGN